MLKRFYYSICIVLALFFIMGGVLIALVMPPFQAPDEEDHWKTAVIRTERLWSNTEEVCSVAFALPKTFATNDIALHPENKLPSGTFAKLKRMKPQCKSDTIMYGSVGTYFGHLVGSMVVKGANKRTRKAVILFYLTRLLHGLAIAAMLLRLLYLAFSHFPLPVPGLLSLCAFLLSPLFFQQSFSVSADVIVNLCVLSTAVLFIAGRNIKAIDVLFFLLIGVMAAFTKPMIAPIVLVYPIVALFLFDRSFSVSGLFVSRGQGLNRFLAVIAALLVVATCGYVLLKSSGHPDLGELAHREANYSLQLQYVLDNIQRVFILFSTQILGLFSLDGYLGPLGWFDAPLSSKVGNTWRSFILVALCIDLLVVCFLLGQRLKNISWAAIKNVFASLVSYGVLTAAHIAYAYAVVLCIYLTCNPVGADFVQAMQHRYYFPNIILFLVSMHVFSALLPYKVSETSKCLRDSCSVWVFTLLLIVLVVILSFYLSNLYLNLVTRYW